MDLLPQAKKLKDSPGVYIFCDRKGKPLYIGRTVSLKKRVLSYFKEDIEPRLKEMVFLSCSIKHKKTDTILEAIILEANLIKKYWPKYNIKDKDNRSFLYIVIPKTDYPRPFIARQRELNKFPQKSYFFGPYQSASILKSALKIIRRIFPYSTCKPFSGKPCFDYQIGLCPGLCVSKISKKDYQKNIRNIIMLLSGQKKKLVAKLKKENLEAAKALGHIQDVSLLAKEELSSPDNISRIEGYDVSHLSGKEVFGSMVVFSNAVPDKKEYRLFRIKNNHKNDDLRALEEMILRRLNHREWDYPDLILIDGGKPQIDFIYKSLEKKNLNIPLVGISKFKNDKLVFPPKTKKSIKELAENMKGILLRVRNEAHRFSIKSSRKKRNKFAKSGF